MSYVMLCSCLWRNLQGIYLYLFYFILISIKLTAKQVFLGISGLNEPEDGSYDLNKDDGEINNSYVSTDETHDGEANSSKNWWKTSAALIREGKKYSMYWA